MALIALDLPAFDRPATATSAPSSGGSWLSLFALVRNRTSGYAAMPACQWCGVGTAPRRAKALVYNLRLAGQAAEQHVRRPVCARHPFGSCALRYLGVDSDMTAKFVALTLVAVLGWTGSAHAAGTVEAG